MASQRGADTVARAPVSIPRRPPNLPRPAGAALLRPFRIPLMRRAMIYVLVGEVVVAALALGLRLRDAMGQWTADVHRQSISQGSGTGWVWDWFSRAPLGRLNTVLEIIAALGIFWLVRHWSITDDLAAARESTWRGWMNRLGGWITSARPVQPQSIKAREPAAKPRAYQGWGRGMAAALLFWLNPALLLNGHGWAGAEVWPVPFVVFATLACSTERWLAGGLLIGLASLLNGRVMLAAPVFLLWPLCMNAPRAALRVCIGFAAAVAVSAAPMLVGSGGIWVAGVMLVPAIVRRKWFNRGPLASIAVTAPIAFVLTVWPVMLTANRTLAAVAVVVLLALGLIFIGRRLGAPWLATEIALAGACAMFLCPVLFGGSLTWAQGRLGAGSELMTAGAKNLAALLEGTFGVRAPDGLYAIDLPALSIYHVLTVKQLLISLYGAGLLVAGWRAAVHSDNRDASTLVALGMPWVLMFVLLPGMGERDLVWGACLGAAWVAAGTGMTLVHLLISGLAFLMIGSVMNQEGALPLGGLVKATEGSLACLVVLAGAMVGWGAVGANRGRRTRDS